MTTHLLYEAASGYALFKRSEVDEITDTIGLQKAGEKYSTFSKVVSLTSFLPFESANESLENLIAVTEGTLTDKLRNFLELHLGVSVHGTLGVYEESLAGAIHKTLNFPCSTDQTVQELLRGIRTHFHKFVSRTLEDSSKKDDLEKIQLGLGHAYSRYKIKFNINKADNNVIQVISLLDQMDKDINLFAMRTREWYSWHFPELSRLVPDNVMYSRVAHYVEAKESFSQDKVAGLEEIVSDPYLASQIYAAAKTSMGTEISELDIRYIVSFAQKVILLAEYRKQLHSYLLSKMHEVAPNLSSLIGEIIGARLISHAGSLNNLAKYPASTVQILGAEKALFRALKTKGNTPKYGVLFNSTFIGKAKNPYKGRISRFLANKCSLASRIDLFSEHPTQKFGELFRDQVDERIRFFESGTVPRKNLDAIKNVAEEVRKDQAEKETLEQQQVKKAENQQVKKPEYQTVTEEQQQVKKAENQEVTEEQTDTSKVTHTDSLLSQTTQEDITETTPSNGDASGTKRKRHENSTRRRRKKRKHHHTTTSQQE